MAGGSRGGAILMGHRTPGGVHDGVPNNCPDRYAMPYEMHTPNPPKTLPRALGPGALHRPRSAWHTERSWLHAEAPTTQSGLQATETLHPLLPQLSALPLAQPLALPQPKPLHAPDIAPAIVPHTTSPSAHCPCRSPSPCPSTALDTEGEREGGMVSPMTLLIGWPRLMKCSPHACGRPSPCSPRAMSALGGKGSSPAHHVGCS